eukprot:scaffold77281_cov56-Attheya_sp.AAC.3
MRGILSKTALKYCKNAEKIKFAAAAVKANSFCTSTRPSAMETKHVKLFEAELARSSHQVKMLEEFLATNSGAAAARSTGLGKIEEELSQLSVIADDNSDDSNESDIYFGNMQAY